MKSFCLAVCCLVSVFVAEATTFAQVLTFGDMDVLGTGTYLSDPTDGTTLYGLLPGEVTMGVEVNHVFPFMPESDDFPGTDQIYTASNQTATGDGYSGFGGRVQGPQLITLDYSSLATDPSLIGTFTLGIAADDFEFPFFGQPYVATINGTEYQPLSNLLNSLSLTGPQVQFFTIGLDTGLLTSDGQLVLSIDQNGDGRDGWAIDFLTVGVTAIPEPGHGIILLTALAIAGFKRRRGPPLA